MVGKTTFLSHLGSTQARLFSVEWPEGYRLVQRREHLRLDTEAPVRYVVVSQSETGGIGDEGSGSTRNISAGGLLFVVKTPILETVGGGDALQLWLQLGQDVVLAEADVIRVEDATDTDPDGRCNRSCRPVSRALSSQSGSRPSPKVPRIASSATSSPSSGCAGGSLPAAGRWRPSSPTASYSSAARW